MILELILFVIILIISYWYLSKPSNLPPGPIGLPIVGYLPWLIYYSNDRLKLFKRLREKYGEIVMFRVGFSYMMILNNVDVIKQAFAKQGDQFSGRGLKFIQQEITHGKGILSSEGPYQREHRRFILKTLRNMGFGKVKFEDHIIDSIRTMQSRIDKFYQDHPNEDMNIQECLVEAVTDNIARIVLGKKFNEEELKFMISRLDLLAQVPPIIFLINSFPLLLPFLAFKWFRNISGIETFKTIRKPLEARIFQYVMEHKDRFDSNDIRDFIYAYLDEQKNHKSTPQEEFAWDDDQIMHASTELIAAGTGTTESTITWILALVANDPEWQQQVSNEIDREIGRERQPSMTDLPNLPLCEATVLETLRWSILAGSGIPHAVTEDTTLEGYFIPNGTAVLPFLYETSREISVWKDPDNFNPKANFLSEDGKTVINRDKDIPFSVGRRSCIGESLARMEVTLFFISLIQKYKLLPSQSKGMPVVTNGIFRIPSHRLIRFEQRN